MSSQGEGTERATGGEGGYNPPSPPGQVPAYAGKTAAADILVIALSSDSSSSGDSESERQPPNKRTRYQDYLTDYKSTYYRSVSCRQSDPTVTHKSASPASSITLDSERPIAHQDAPEVKVPRLHGTINVTLVVGDSGAKDDNNSNLLAWHPRFRDPGTWTQVQEYMDVWDPSYTLESGESYLLLNGDKDIEEPNWIQHDILQQLQWDNISELTFESSEVDSEPDTDEE